MNENERAPDERFGVEPAGLPSRMPSWMDDGWRALREEQPPAALRARLRTAALALPADERCPVGPRTRLPGRLVGRLLRVAALAAGFLAVQLLLARRAHDQGAERAGERRVRTALEATTTWTHPPLESGLMAALPELLLAQTFETTRSER